MVTAELGHTKTGGVVIVHQRRVLRVLGDEIFDMVTRHDVLSVYILWLRHDFRDRPFARGFADFRQALVFRIGPEVGQRFR